MGSKPSSETATLGRPLPLPSSSAAGFEEQTWDHIISYIARDNLGGDQVVSRFQIL
jgi:hypothetical protein